MLDGVAAFKFLFEGSPKHFFAVIQARFAYYTTLPSTVTKRKELKKMNTYRPATTGILDDNIVLLHYINKCNKFSDINF